MLLVLIWPSAVTYSWGCLNSSSRRCKRHLTVPGIEVTWLYGMEYRPLLPMNSMEEMFYWYVTISISEWYWHHLIIAHLCSSGHKNSLILQRKHSRGHLLPLCQGWPFCNAMTSWSLWWSHWSLLLYMAMSTVNTIKYGFKQKFTLQYIDLILANSWWKVFGVWLPQYIICTSENTLQAVLPLEGRYHGP